MDCRDFLSQQLLAADGRRAGTRRRSTRSWPSGYTLVYGVLRLINFAHSEIFMIGHVRRRCSAVEWLGITTAPSTDWRSAGHPAVLAARLDGVLRRHRGAAGARRLPAAPQAWRSAPGSRPHLGHRRLARPPGALRPSRSTGTPRPHRPSPAASSSETPVSSRSSAPTSRPTSCSSFVAAVRDDGAPRPVREAAAGWDGASAPWPRTPRPPSSWASTSTGSSWCTFLLGGIMAGGAGDALRGLLRGHPVQRRLPARHQGLHRRRARRHRQHPRRPARRPRCSAWSRSTAPACSGASGRTSSPSSCSCSC